MQWRYVSVFTFAILALVMLAPPRASAAVTISSFTAQAKAPQIQVAWTTATEINNAGFNLLRSTTQSGTYAQIAGLIPAKNPGSILGASYSYSDGAVTSGQTYFYKLVSVENSGATQQFGPVSASLPAPATATATPLPPTATSTLAPTAVPTATSTPTSTPIPPTRTQVPTVAATPSSSRAAKVVQPRASSTPDAGTAVDNSELPTPGVTLVALGLKQDTSDPEVNSSHAETNNSAEDSSSTRSYYLSRLIDVTVLLTAVTLLFGSFVLGALSVFFFLRTYLR